MVSTQGRVSDFDDLGLLRQYNPLFRLQLFQPDDAVKYLEEVPFSRCWKMRMWNKGPQEPVSLQAL